MISYPGHPVKGRSRGGGDRRAPRGLRVPSSRARCPQMFQDLEIIDFHCHFPVAGDPSMAVAGGSARMYEAGSPADEKARYLGQQAEKYRAAWRLAWDFPEPEREARPPEEQADRWLAE